MDYMKAFDIGCHVMNKMKVHGIVGLDRTLFGGEG